MVLKAVQAPGISYVAVTFGLKQAQGFARHKQFSTTADVYADVADRRKREVGRAMGGLVRLPQPATGSATQGPALFPRPKYGL
jgi:hypothetical protein